MKRSVIPRLFQVSKPCVTKPFQRRNRYESLESRVCLAASFATTDWTDSSQKNSLAESPSSLANDSFVADDTVIDDPVIDDPVVEQVDQIIESLPDELLDDIENNKAPWIDDAVSNDVILDDGSLSEDDASEGRGDESLGGDELETGSELTGLAIASEEGLFAPDDASEIMRVGVGGAAEGNLTATENSLDGSPQKFGIAPTDDQHTGFKPTTFDNESTRQIPAHDQAEHNRSTTSGHPVDPSMAQVPGGPRLANVPTLPMPATLLSAAAKAGSSALEDISGSLARRLATAPSFSQSSPMTSSARPPRTAPAGLRPRLADVNVIAPTLPSLPSDPLPSLNWEANAPIAAPNEQGERSESLKPTPPMLQSPPPEATTIRETTRPGTDSIATKLSAFWAFAVASLISFPQLRRPSRNIARLIRDKSLRYRPMSVEPLVYQSKQGETDTLQPNDRT
jgi:hypothetical protein